MNSTDSKYDFALVKEMLETPDLVANFDFQQCKKIADMVRKTGRIFLTGEGSSRIFPAKSFIYDVLRYGLAVSVATDGSFQASEYDLSNWVVCGASNSGQTKEIIALLKTLKDNGHKYLAGVTSNAGTKIFDVTDETILLSCGKENAVAATKSVVEQALVYRAIFADLTQCPYASDGKKAGEEMRQILEAEYDAEIVKKLADAPFLYFAGRNNGVGEELTLKTNEITRKKCDFLEGTYLLHGVEEVMREGETCVLIEPFESECAKIKELIADRAGVNVIAIATKDTIFPTIKIPENPAFCQFYQLMAGWNLLVHTGIALGVNLDKPARARKIGNVFED
ncbi:MAG: SIS domain-containing protein [Thermoguttaceae bacterium]|jgi:glucosamine--fructose-6-phosphate aminotransferase (isomerizing)